MTKTIITATILSLFTCLQGFSQEQDSTFAPPPDDTLLVRPVDTVLTLPPDSASADTLTPAQKAGLDFEMRQRKYLEEKEEKRQNLQGVSYFDSLVVYFASPRLSMEDQVARSFYHDPGDYFRSLPSYFVMDYESTPLRKTVQPFGLTGNRLNLLINRLMLTPFEHNVEPDGLVDMSDLPTALNQKIYIFPGPIGMLFGGRQAIASLVTFPEKQTTTDPHSALLVDKGGHGYDLTRGRYSKLFTDGRTMDLATEYRTADGSAFGRRDNAYQYAGKVYIPVGERAGLNFNGQLYSRGSMLPLRLAAVADSSGVTMERNRIDRNLQTGWQWVEQDNPVKSEIGYRHHRQGSNMDGDDYYAIGTYRTRLDVTGHGLFASREWMTGGSMFLAEMSGDWEEYRDSYDKYRRLSGALTINMIRLVPGWRYGVTAGAQYVESTRLLPTAMLTLYKETAGSFVMLSAGYTERAPSLYELHLRPQRYPLYPEYLGDYAESGNDQLVPEKQLIANASAILGPDDKNIGLAITGGRITDGIDWRRDPESDTAGSYLQFAPVNGDLDFVDVSLNGKYRLYDFLRVVTGAAYHYTDYAAFESRPYVPDVQAFFGGELHLWWPQKLLDLYAYGELQYVGRYDGYDVTGLGEDVIANTKLSFRLKNFRFHFVVQDIFATGYESREGLAKGRFSYYGFEWKFFD